MWKALLVVSVLGACMVGEVAPSPPDPPSQLTAVTRDGGAHLTWRDNSIDEAHFMVMRMEMTEHGSDEHAHDSDHAFAALATLDHGSTEHHDTSVVSGTTYTYVVSAMGAAGADSESNQVTFAAR